MVGPDSLGKAVTSTVQITEAKTNDLGPCDSGIGSDLEEETKTYVQPVPVEKLKEVVKYGIIAKEEPVREKCKITKKGRSV